MGISENSDEKTTEVEIFNNFICKIEDKTS